jgi:F-type H+-transporting ATPase subunit epsilon
MADNLYLEIVSPQGIIFEGNVDQVTLPSVNGAITVLPHHAALFTKLHEGEIEVVQEGKRMSYVIAGERKRFIRLCDTRREHRNGKKRRKKETSRTKAA